MVVHDEELDRRARHPQVRRYQGTLNDREDDEKVSNFDKAGPPQFSQPAQRAKLKHTVDLKRRKMLYQRRKHDEGPHSTAGQLRKGVAKVEHPLSDLATKEDKDGGLMSFTPLLLIGSMCGVVAYAAFKR